MPLAQTLLFWQDASHSGCFSLPDSFSRKQDHCFETFCTWIQPKKHICALMWSTAMVWTSLLPVGLYLQYLAENTVLCQRGSESFKLVNRLVDRLKNPKIKGLSCLPGLGRSNPSIVPLNVIAPKHIDRGLQLSSAHFTQTNQYYPTVFSSLWRKG